MNSPLARVFLFKIRSALRYLKSQTAGKIITAGIGMLLFLGVGFSIYRFGVSGLEFLQGYILYKEAFTLYVYELYLAVFFYITSFSSMLFLLFTLLRSSDDNWILATPKFKIIPFYYLGKIASSSLISILLLAVPLTLAIKTVFETSLLSFFLMLLNVSLLSVIAMLFSVFLVFATAQLLKMVSGKTYKFVTVFNIMIICLFIFILLLVLGWKKAVPSDFIEFWQIPITDVQEFDVNLVETRFTFMPSHSPSLFLFHLQEDKYPEAIFHFAVTTVTTAILAIATYLSTRGFLTIWQKLQEGSFEARTKINFDKTLPIGKFPKILKGQIGALFEKEFVVMRRDLKDIAWVSFILSLWLIYTAINLLLKRAMQKYDFGSESMADTVFAFQIAVGIYFITAFVLRYVFPSFSTERKTAWIIGSSPVSLKKVMYSKFFFFSFLFSIMGLGVSIFNLVVFLPGIIPSLLYILIFITTVITTTLLGLFLGFVFPNFETDNPEVLGTSVPGLIFTFAAILYGAWGALTFYKYIRLENLACIATFEVVSFILIFLMLRFSFYFLKRIEFAQSMFLA
ncbi:hypothetical protein JW766_00685 [Candidatus Dojkabacteria bacterium]|nr:hypothetical protein [Candidatus Dojkabacteria bacterium]